MNTDEHAVFNQDNFYEAFERDLHSAQGLVLLQSPFLATRRIERLRNGLKSSIQRGIRICVFAQAPNVRHPLSEESLTRVKALEEAATMLTSLGGHVSFRSRIHEKLAVIDETILWDGSLNILSQNNTHERMTRWLSTRKVHEAIKQHNLDSCDYCDIRLGHHSGLHSIGRYIAKRRKLLGLSQTELAKKTGVRQSTISEVESGLRDLKWSTLCRLGQVLLIDYRCLPWFMLPSLDERLRE